MVDLALFIGLVPTGCDRRAPSRAKKKPAWSNTLRYSAPPAYSSMGPLHCRVALLLVIRRLQPKTLTKPVASSPRCTSPRKHPYLLHRTLLSVLLCGSNNSRHPRRTQAPTRRPG